MKSNPLVLQRFEELGAKAEEIRENRTPDFVAQDGTQYYDIDTAEFKAWSTSVLNLLQRVFGEDSVHFKHFAEQAARVRDSELAFLDAVGIFRAAREDYEGGYLFNMQSLVRAEVFDDVLEQAEALLNAGYKDPACTVAGVSLEVALRDLASRHSVSHAKLDRMNSDLAKAGVYNKGMQKQITAWADRRNSAAHGQWGDYTDEDVRDMVRGVRRLIAELL